MRYLLFWDIWSADPGMRAYFKLKDHQIIGTPHGATILDRIMKNEAANHPSNVVTKWRVLTSRVAFVWRSNIFPAGLPKNFITFI